MAREIEAAAPEGKKGSPCEKSRRVVGGGLQPRKSMAAGVAERRVAAHAVSRRAPGAPALCGMVTWHYENMRA